MPARKPKRVQASEREAPEADRSPSLPARGAEESPCSNDSQTPNPSERGSQSPRSTEEPRDGDKPPFDLDEFDTLREMLHEYKAHRIDFSSLPKRPKFKDPRVNSGFTCNSEVRKRASAKAKTDPHGTGGSISSLIELLLWKYLGCPSDVIEDASGKGNDL